MTSESNHYLFINNETQGPFTTDQIQQMMAVGELSVDTLVFNRARQDWEPLTKSDILPPPPPPARTKPAEQFRPTRTANPIEKPEPRLWNPTPASIWSLFLTPIFGQILVYKNWKSLGEDSRASTSKIWLIVTALGFLGTLVAAATSLFIEYPKTVNEYLFVLFRQILVQIAVALIPFGLLIAWFFFEARKQIEFINSSLEKGYQKKSWLMPIFVAWVLVSVYTTAISLLNAPLLAHAEKISDATPTPVVANERPIPAGQSLYEQAGNYMEAYRNGNWGVLVAMMRPSVVASLGGVEAATQVLAEAAEFFRISEYQIGQPQFGSSGGNNVAFIPTVFFAQRRLPDNRIIRMKSVGGVIAVKENNGSWLFQSITPEEVESLRSEKPGLLDTIVIPKEQVFIETSDGKWASAQEISEQKEPPPAKRPAPPENRASVVQQSGPPDATVLAAGEYSQHLGGSVSGSFTRGTPLIYRGRLFPSGTIIYPIRFENYPLVIYFGQDPFGKWRFYVDGMDDLLPPE